MIKALSVTDAISYLMPRCFLAYHDQKLMNLAIDNLERIISAVPIYLFGCRPDREAVELVHRCLGQK
jgi:lipid II:glycine glycyltransferase (peptidoglycan interpeptide bridge formation enzyme)